MSTDYTPQTHERGDDGYLTPYTDDEVRHYVEACASNLPLFPDDVIGIRYDTALFLYSQPTQECGLGPRLSWVVSRDGNTIASGYLERDDEWEAEGNEPAWVGQAAFVLPEVQRQGIYTCVLRNIPIATGIRVLPDTQQTLASARLWEKRRSQK